MFAFIKAWREKRALARRAAAGAIFPYWDGAKVRYGDPFRIWRDLTQDPKVNLERLLPELDEGNRDAVETALAHVCAVFRVHRWHEANRTGLTDLELLNLLGEVLRWTNFVKKNISPGPTSPPATAATSSASPELQGETRSASSDSTSAASDSMPAGPTPSTEPSATPSAAS